MAADVQSKAREIRWGLPDVFIGLAVSWAAAVVVLVAVVAASGLEAGGATGTGSYVGRYGLLDALEERRIDPALPLWTLPVGQIGLWAGLGLTAAVSAALRGNGLRRDFGWSMRVSDVPLGLAVGVFAQIVVVFLIYAPFQQFFDFDVSEAARQITDRAASPGDIALVMLGVVVGAPVFEELFFRGLTLRAFERKWGAWAGVLVSSAIFGAVHLQPLQFPALMAFGIIAALLVRRYQRLGPAIWAHVGFNLIAVINLIWLA
ncbi:CPBP family intramembrane glutamic endopeptidase [Candidatus Poriferisocius sp.]|uniref:CPBP family intramembrane glutamic endopeptidase n=1 Tax=Candidatus Poriferisocius sp. TaxID=3101276 RepID=UPI003B01D227